MATFGITYQFRDTKGVDKTLPLNFDSGDAGVDTIAEIQVVADEYAALLEAMTGAKITEYYINSYPLVNAISNSADAGYRVGAAALLSFVDSDGLAQQVYVPAALDSVFNGKEVNVAAASVAAFADAATAGTGITGTVKLSSVKTGSQFNALRGGKLSHLK